MSVNANVDPRSKRVLLEEVEQLRGLLDEAEQTLDAIRSGDVDALVVNGPHGEQVYSLANVELTYRLIVETMNEAALTVDVNGMILFCNQRFCDLLKISMSKAIGCNVSGFFTSVMQTSLRKLLADVQVAPVSCILTMQAADNAIVPVKISANALKVDDLVSVCLVVTDLTDIETKSASILLMGEQHLALEQSRVELQNANTLLRDSRRAALNIMEDAILTRLKTEEANERLQYEIGERIRVEGELQKAHDNLELRVRERTEELKKLNTNLMHEIAERKKAEDFLQNAYAEITKLKLRLQAENIYLQQEVSEGYNFGEIVGQSEAMSKVFLRVEQVAPMDATVLLLGETGVGKGMIARAIHSRSARKGRPMITVNCTALPANLIESELFGRERGAFTGADARQIGRFELADGGTIFLDEIGEMQMDLQCKLLRVIQDGEFERLGSPRTIKVNVRVIAASNRNLEEEVKNGRFREDLFYRLNVFPITIPSLRKRTDDIPLLVNHFITKFNKKNSKKITNISKDTMKALQEYYWPGNVRELENVIERAVIISQGPTLQILDRFEAFQKPSELADQDVKALSEMEHDHILQVLQQTGWRIEGSKGAALILGLNPSTLRARMRKYGIQRQ